MPKGYFVRSVALASILLGGCTVHQTEIPALTGPSEFAQSFALTATPDNITQDGLSQSAIVITARDANGQALPNLQLQLQTLVNGSSVAFGTLSSATVFTGSDGKARAMYTAPTASPFLAGGPGRIVTISAMPIGSNYATAVPQGVQVLVTPPAARPASAGGPAVSVTFAPAAPKVGQVISFDASASQPGSGRSLVTYVWDFGDNRSNDEHGTDASHAYSSAGTYTMVVGVVDDAGNLGSSIQTIVVTN